MAASRAAVSSVVPSPFAPKSLTLIMSVSRSGIVRRAVAPVAGKAKFKKGVSAEAGCCTSANAPAPNPADSVAFRYLLTHDGLLPFLNRITKATSGAPEFFTTPRPLELRLRGSLSARTAADRPWPRQHWKQLCSSPAGESAPCNALCACRCPERADLLASVRHSVPIFKRGEICHHT
jgi:hypothetical protein